MTKPYLAHHLYEAVQRAGSKPEALAALLLLLAPLEPANPETFARWDLPGDLIARLPPYQPAADLLTGLGFTRARADTEATVFTRLHPTTGHVQALHRYWTESFELFTHPPGQSPRSVFAGDIPDEAFLLQLFTALHWGPVPVR